MFDEGETLELLKHGFVPCTYLQTYCPACGSMRLMTDVAPNGEYVDCPSCGRSRCNCGVLGAGYTRSPLPHFEVLFGPVNAWPEDDDARTTPLVDGRVVEALRAGKSYRAVAQECGISANLAWKTRRRAGLPSRQVHAR
jgi:hypothetical protein